LGYADKIFRLPLTVLIAAVYTGLHPYLAEAAASRRFDDFQLVVDRISRATLFILLPIGLALVVLSQPIVVMVYQRGAFTASAADATAGVLLYLGLQIPFLGLWYVYDRAFVCLGRTSYLMGFALLLVAAKWMLSIVLIKALGLPGVACATLIAIFGMSLLMRSTLNHMFGKPRLALPTATILKILLAAVAAALLAAWTWSSVGQGLAWANSPIGHTSLVLIVMAIAYASIWAALNPHTIGDSLRRIH
jgi:putative peptidoglycan lipid II flippase